MALLRSRICDVKPHVFAWTLMVREREAVCSIPNPQGGSMATIDAPAKPERDNTVKVRAATDAERAKGASISVGEATQVVAVPKPARKRRRTAAERMADADTDGTRTGT